MTLTLRYMRNSDVPHVMEIETASVTPSWGEHSFHFEIDQSRVSYMLVLTETTLRPSQGLRRWLDTLRGIADPQETDHRSSRLAACGTRRRGPHQHHRLATDASRQALTGQSPWPP